MIRTLLNNFASPVLMALVVGFTLIVGLGSEAAQRRRGRTPERRSNEMLVLTVEFVGLAYAILVGFVIVSLWQDQAEAREAVSSEASTLQDIVSISRVLPPDDANGIRAAVRSYCQAVVDEEWALLRRGSTSPRAEARAQAIFSAVTAVDSSGPVATTLQSSMIGSVRDFAARRNHRLELADVRLPGELWLLVILATFVLIVLVSGFESDGPSDIRTTLVIAGMMGMLLFAIVALSYPFSGDVSISPEPFVAVARSLTTA
jgi:hypothetical protein